MTLYHIEKSKYKDVWPPEGTLHGRGRWNKVGQWIIYCSPTIALAKLEILANDNLLPIDRVCMTIEVYENTSVFEIDESLLPENWYGFPASPELTKITGTFLESDHLLMRVPSAQCHREYNLLINVRHPNFHDAVKLVDVSPEIFDPRLK